MPRSRLRILLISTSVLPIGFRRYGGIEKIVYDFAEELALLGHKVTVAAPIGSRVPKGVSLIETISLPAQQDCEAHAFYSYCHSLDEFDIIHDFSHTHVADRYVKSLPTLNVVWDNMTERYAKARKNIACLSLWQMKQFIRLYEQNARVVSPICVNSKRFELGKERSDRFLHIGKCTPEKGALDAIRICKELGVGLDLIGGLLPTDPTTFRDRLIDECDGEQIVFHGEVADDVKIKLMQTARAVINPRRLPEAHWHAGVEAMMTGCPVIAYSHSSYPEFILNGLAGFLVNDEREFKSAMFKVDELNPVMIRDYAKSRFDRTLVVNDNLTIYTAIISGERW